jgi:hypothetical protein
VWKIPCWLVRVEEIGTLKLIFEVVGFLPAGFSVAQAIASPGKVNKTGWHYYCFPLSPS